MKWHKEITSDKWLVYNRVKAKMLLGSKQPRTLSKWKQENIRMAIKEGMPLEAIRDIVGSDCGFCLKHYRCSDCPIWEKLDEGCSDSVEWDDMFGAETLPAFAFAHEKWCIKIGLWNKNWT